MDSNRRIVLVEFCGGKPFSVATRGPGDGDTDFYDFEWCKREKMLLWHMSGCGFEPCLSEGHTYWIADDEFDRLSAAGNIPAFKRLRRMPKRWPLDSLFDGVDSAAEYCSICDDWLPAERNNPCSHLHYCDECCCWRGIGSEEGECKHVAAGLGEIMEDREQVASVEAVES